MNTLSPEVQLGIIFGLITLIGKVFDLGRDYFKNRTELDRADAEADTRAATERARLLEMSSAWQKMLSTTLAEQHEKYAALAVTFKEGLDDVVVNIQQAFTLAAQQMADVTTKRNQDLVLLRTDVRTVPAEVERLIKPKFDELPSQIWTVGEPHLAALRDELERYLQGMEARLVTKLDAPEAAPARQMLLEELHELRELGVRQFDMLTARMSAIDQTLAALKTTPAGEEKISDPAAAAAADIS